MIERENPILMEPRLEPIPVVKTTFGELEIGECFIYWGRLGSDLYEKIGGPRERPNARNIRENIYPQERRFEENSEVYIEDLGFLICKLFSKML